MPPTYPRPVSSRGHHSASDAERLLSLEHRIDDLEQTNARLRSFVLWLIAGLLTVLLGVIGFAYAGYSAYANRLIEVSQANQVYATAQAERWGRIEAQLAEIQRRLDRAP